ncbi:MAG: CAP domain-containing protein [Betaproteobacteria bacterium]|nr:CAP domain-containing protein [Betaproteobacteria bacterium]
MQEAMSQAGYPSMKSMSIQVSGATSEAGVVAFLQPRHCAALTDSAFKDIGIHRDGANVWIVLGAPFLAPAVQDAPHVARKVLELVNQARATARSCGTTSLVVALPLKANPLLTKAAQLHANDMAEGSHFSHTGRDGSAPSARVTRVGYAWQMTSENIAAGAGSAEETVAGWLNSPPHCANIMEARYTEHGVAFAINEKSKGRIYWAQVFGRPF